MKIKYEKYQPIYKVENESLEAISKKFDIPILTLKKINQVETVAKGDYIVLPKENIYVVKPMESLPFIAKKLNVSVDYLKEKNKIERVFIGQILFY